MFCKKVLVPSTPREDDVSLNCRRIVVMGTMGVGKTAVVARFLDGVFDDRHIPTIEDFHQKLYQIQSESYKLDILDTSGINPFPAMRQLLIQTADMFILVYAIDQRESFEEVKRLRAQILQVKAQMMLGLQKAKRKTHTPIVIAGNKCDRDPGRRQVSTAELRKSVSGYPGCAALEISAKKNTNIEECFLELFLLANLPTELSPPLRNKARSLPAFVRPSPARCHSRRKTLSERLTNLYSVVTKEVERPSIGMDMLMIKQLKATALNELNPVQATKCNIQ